MRGRVLMCHVIMRWIPERVLTLCLRMLLLPTVTVAAAGCGDPPADYGPVQADVVVGDEYDFDHLWETVLRVLRRVNLRPDRQDRRAGIITTLPITCQQWFEFWRHDAMGPYQWAEASMHTMQRLAVVKISRRPEPDRYRIDVKVDVFRHSAPERQVTTPSGAMLMYSEKRPTEEGERLEPHEAIYWVHVGRDPQMEGVLLRRILMHYPDYELIDEPPEEDEWEDAVEQAPPSQPSPSDEAEPPGPPAPTP